MSSLNGNHDFRVLTGAAQPTHAGRVAGSDQTLLAAVVESAPDAVVLSDVKGSILYVNPAFERLTGYLREDAIGRDLDFFKAIPGPSASLDAIRPVIARQGYWRGRFTSRRKDGTRFQEECTLSALRSPCGEITHYVSVRRDVTEQQRLESIAETSREMDSIEAVFSGLRREIGNPINAVNMTLGMLWSKLEQDPRSNLREYLERARGELQKVIDLLNTIKIFGMPARLALRSFRVDQFLSSLVVHLQKCSSGQGISITQTLPASETFCYADPRALQQVLLSVFNNSLGFCQLMESPAISFHLDMQPPWIRIQIEDNAPGLTQAQRRELWKPLPTANPPGVGLGLALARKLLARMNGTIDLAEARDRGTCFEIRIPADERLSARPEKVEPTI